MTQELSLWIKKILILLVISIGIYLLWTLSSIVLILLISAFITTVLNPLIEKWEKRKIPSWLTLICVYILVIILWSIVIGSLVPIIVNYLTNTTTLIINWVNLAQSTNLVEWIKWFGFHSYIEKGLLLILHEDNIWTTLAIIKDNIWSLQSVLTTQLSSITSGGLSVVSSIGNSLVNTGLIAVTTFLMVLERKRIWKFFLEVAPTGMDRQLERYYSDIQNVTTSWIKATLILSISIFTATYIGLMLIKWIFGIDTEQAFTLALIGGIMEFIPYIWPLIALIPAAIIWLGISWQAAFIITILYLIIQRLENDILVPVVMSKALDLSPFLVFSVMLIGGTLWGILGIILAVPVAWVLRVIYGNYKSKRIKEDTTEIDTSLPVKKLIPNRKIAKN